MWMGQFLPQDKMAYYFYFIQEGKGMEHVTGGQLSPIFAESILGLNQLAAAAA